MVALAEPVAVRPLGLAGLVGTGLLGWLGLRSGNPWLLFLACASGAPLLVGWLARPRLDALAVRWRGPHRAMVGELVEHHFEVQNTGRRPTPVATLVHQVHGYPPATILIPALPPGGTADVALTRRPQLRTVSHRHHLTASTGAPFGFVEHRRVWHLDATLVIHPGPVEPDDVPRWAGDGDEPSGARARTGAHPHGIRQWRPGDDRRHVHWRATARHGRLVVVEPEQTVSPRLALVVAGDAGHLPWEALVSRAAWTAVAAIRAGREVLLVAEDPWPPAPVLVPPPPPPGAPFAAAVGSFTDCRTTDPATALDWFAALRSPQLTRAAVSRAAAWAGPGGDVVLVATDPALCAGLADDGLADEHLAVLLPVGGR